MSIPIAKSVSTKLVVLISSVSVLVVGGGLAATLYAFDSAEKAKVAELCDVAVSTAETANRETTEALKQADDLLSTVQNEGFLYGAGSIIYYPNSISINETYLPVREKTHASDLALVTELERTQAKLSGHTLQAVCENEEDAASLVRLSQKVEESTSELDAATEALTADYKLYAEVQEERIEADERAIVAAAEAADAAAQEATDNSSDCMFADCLPHNGGGMLIPSL